MQRKQFPLVRSSAQSGFTLIEIIIVLGILGGLFAFILTQVGSSNESARKKETAVRAGQVQSALLRYQADMGKMPTTAEGLSALLANPGGSSKWSGPYGAEEDIQDAYGSTFEFDLTPKGAKLTSPGKDMQAGTEDDLVYINGREVTTNNAPGGQAE